MNLRNAIHFVGILEGLSCFALMAVAMPMKYFWQSISKENFYAIGMGHGVLFVIYALIVTAGLIQRQVTVKQYFLLAFFSLLPLGPIIADRFVMKHDASRV